VFLQCAAFKLTCTNHITKIVCSEPKFKFKFIISVTRRIRDIQFTETYVTGGTKPFLPYKLVMPSGLTRKSGSPLQRHRLCKPVVGSGLSSKHREVFCPSSARSRITYMFGVFGSFFSQLRRAFLLLRQRISVQSRETSRFSTPRANFVFVTLTLMQGKLVMVCVCRPLV